ERDCVERDPQALILAAVDGGRFETLPRQRRLDIGARIARQRLDRASRKRGNLVGLVPRRTERRTLFHEAPLEPLGLTRQRLPDQQPGNQDKRDTADNEPGSALRRGSELPP